MRNKIKVLTIIIMILFFTEIFSKRVLERKIEKGNYVPRILLNASSIRNLPVSKTRENYAILQSIGLVTNIVIGNFKSGEGIITLYSDRNNDGKVDFVARWYQSTNKVRFLPLPGKICSPELFKTMKMKILNGNWNTELSPNKEGGPYIKKIIMGNSTVRRWRHGYRVLEYDPDRRSKIRTSFFYEYKPKLGASVVFDVKYHHRGRVDLSPVINVGVYCSSSKDAVVIEYMKDLVQYTSKNIAM